MVTHFSEQTGTKAEALKRWKVKLSVRLEGEGLKKQGANYFLFSSMGVITAVHKQNDYYTV